MDRALDHLPPRVDDFEKGILLALHGDTLDLEFAYPRTTPEKVQYLEVGLCDVRASDGIRISYDFERGGYKIEQPYWVEERKEDERGTFIDQVDRWEEVAFLPSWALEHKNVSVAYEHL